MPEETQVAVDWALQREGVVQDNGVDVHALVDTVRSYFDAHNIECRPMSGDDLIPYLPEGVTPQVGF